MLLGVLAVCVHILCPKRAQIAVLAIGVFCVLNRILIFRPWVQYKSARCLVWMLIWIEAACTIALPLLIMSDDWCSYYLYKGL